MVIAFVVGLVLSGWIWHLCTRVTDKPGWVDRNGGGREKRDWSKGWNVYWKKSCLVSLEKIGSYIIHGWRSIFGSIILCILVFCGNTGEAHVQRGRAEGGRGWLSGELGTNPRKIMDKLIEDWLNIELKNREIIKASHHGFLKREPIPDGVMSWVDMGN